MDDDLHISAYDNIKVHQLEYIWKGQSVQVNCKLNMSTQ